MTAQVNRARGRCRGRTALLLTATAAAAGAAALPAARAVTALAQAPGAAPPSAIEGTVLWIAVSPAYERTGLVLASASAPGCAKDCLRLWVSRDGGATWRRSPAAGWGQGRMYVAGGVDGHDVVFSESSSGLQRSDDDGATWRTAGPPGSPAISPAFAHDGLVAVASSASSSADYVLRDAGLTPASGSGGLLADLGFMLSPAYPSSGHFAPALLSAADPHTQAPVVERCDAEFRCQGASTTLASAGPWAVPVSLYPSPAYAADGTVFAKAGRSIYKSSDGGAGFVPLTVLPDRGGSVTAYPMLALAPGYSETGPVRTVDVAVLQVTIDQNDPRRSHSTGGVYTSVDGGATWSRLGSPSPLDTGASALAVAPDGRLFAGYVGGSDGAAGLLCSTDGTRWQATCPPVSTVPGGAAAAVAEGPTVACTGTCAPPSAASGPRRTGTMTTAGSGAASVDPGASPSAARTAAHSASGDPRRLILVTTTLLALAATALRVLASFPSQGWRARRRATSVSLHPTRHTPRGALRARRNCARGEHVSSDECRDSG